MSACPACCASSRSTCNWSAHTERSPRPWTTVSRSSPVNVRPRRLATAAMSVLDGCDRVRIRQREGTVGCTGDADLRRRPTADGLVEPHAFDVGDVLEQSEQRGLRRHEAQPRLLLGQPVQRIVQRCSILVEQLVESLPKIRRPLGGTLGRCTHGRSVSPRLVRTRRGRRSAVTSGDDTGLAPRRHPELREDPRDVDARRLVTDEQGRCRSLGSWRRSRPGRAPCARDASTRRVSRRRVNGTPVRRGTLDESGTLGHATGLLDEHTAPDRLGTTDDVLEQRTGRGARSPAANSRAAPSISA